MNTARRTRRRHVQVVEDGRDVASSRRDIVSRVSLARLAGLRTVLLAVVFGSLGALVPPARTAGETTLSSRERTIVVGRVSEDPKKHFARIEAFASYLARRLESVGIAAPSVVIAKDNQQMLKYLRQGKVDLVSETALSALLFVEQAGAEILLREWKKGVPTYRTVFFARAESGITALPDLRDRTIAFEDRGSTSAFLLPLAMLRREGLEPVELSSPQAVPPAGRVGYAFANGEVNIVTWVARGLVDAGALSDGDWGELARAPEPLKVQLEIFHTSKPIIRSLVVARSGLRPEVKARVKEILLDMHNDPDAADVLKVYNKVKKYDEIKGEVAESLGRARGVFARIRNKME